MTREYALYKGDELLGVGTIDELAEELGIKPKTVRHYGYPGYKRRTSEKARRLVKLDEI